VPYTAYRNVSYEFVNTKPTNFKEWINRTLSLAVMRPKAFVELPSLALLYPLSLLWSA